MAAGAALVAGLCDYAQAARRSEIDPVGTWSCVLYGNPEFGDERVLLHLAPNGAARLARVDVEDDKVSSWTALAGWTEEDRELRFGDPQTGRLFTADLRRETLGGGWRTVTAVGGWWCSAIDASTVPQQQVEAAKPAPPLIPTLTATPAYPLLAIRAAKQGRAVTCFFVTADGLIVQPDLIEISDEVFRAPILSALRRSRYQPWKEGTALRPSCRTYTFKLDSLLHPQVDPES